MDPSVIFVIIFLLIILIFILLLLYFHPGSTGTTGATAANPALFIPYSYWGGATGVSGPREACGTYTFQGELTDGITGQEGTYIAIPGDVTLDVNTLNNCLPVTDIGASGITGFVCFGPSTANSNSCTDPDQISAQLMVHTCTSVGTNGLGCRDAEGNTYAVGATALFYSACTTSPCTAPVAAIALNFVYSLGDNPNDLLGSAFCLTKAFIPNGNTGASGSTGSTGSYLIKVSDSNCNFELNQLWRIYRANLSQTGSGFTSNPNGIYAYVQDRVTGLCIVPSVTGVTGVTGGVPRTTTLTLGTCQAGAYPWLLAPPIQIGAYTTPNQFVWAPNPVPLTSTSDLINFIDNYNPLSMWPNNSEQEVMLEPFYINGDVVNSGYSANYLDYTLFNLILENPLLYQLNS